MFGVPGMSDTNSEEVGGEVGASAKGYQVGRVKVESSLHKELIDAFIRICQGEDE